MQKLQVIGNLGADAELQEKNGKKFITFKIADTTKFKRQDGTESETTTWISCIMSGDGGNVLQYLRKGVKVFVDGKPSYKMYSSPKERCMMAGVDLQVFSVELCGGSSDDVPRRLVQPESGLLVDVTKFYYAPVEKGHKPTILFGERGGEYQWDAKGYITPVKHEEQQSAE